MRIRTIALTAAAALAWPASAAAADTFVDPDTGNNANNCTQAAVTGPGAGPCATISAAIPKASNSGTVHVDRGDTYNETAFLETGVSLLGDEVNASDTGPAIINGGAGLAVFIQNGVNAGSVSNLTLRGDGGVQSSGTGTATVIAQNLFESLGSGATGISLLASDSALITGNTLVGNGSTNQAAISVADGTATVTGNDVTGFWLGIAAGGSSPTSATSTPVIRDNTITGTHQQGMQAGAGIFVTTGANPVIESNTITTPGTGTSFGIAVSGFSAPASTGVTSKGNLVTGHHGGISIKDTGIASTSMSDAVTGSAGPGFEVGDQTADDPGIGDISIVNATAWGNTPDITTIQNALTLDSSIVQDPINQITANCTITFSRGPTTTPGGNGCANFQTNADPHLAADNVHLLPGSPMIDAGNPAAPAAGVFDIDGLTRAVDNTPGCPPENDVKRRDIGADEAPPTAIPQCPAPFVPPPDPPKAKCPKGKVLKKVKPKKGKGKAKLKCVKKKKSKRKK